MQRWGYGDKNISRYIGHNFQKFIFSQFILLDSMIFLRAYFFVICFEQIAVGLFQMITCHRICGIIYIVIFFINYFVKNIFVHVYMTIFVLKLSGHINYHQPTHQSERHHIMMHISERHCKCECYAHREVEYDHFFCDSLFSHIHHHINCSKNN
jgi:hypothetical protein